MKKKGISEKGLDLQKYNYYFLLKSTFFIFFTSHILYLINISYSILYYFHFIKTILLKISIIISMELPMNPLRLEATIGFMAGEPGSSLKIILFLIS